MPNTTSNPWVGIDFGTCRTSAAVFLGGEVHLVNLSYGASGESRDMPTAVFFESSGKILVGTQAVRTRFRNPSRYLDGFKLSIGNPRGATVLIDGVSKTVSWHDIVAAVLSYVRLAAERDFNNGMPLSKAVLTVPAIYAQGGDAWLVMEEAARLAGFCEIEIIREPQSAALYYEFLLRQAAQQETSDKDLSLIYDLGGGTLDPALIQRHGGTYEILGVSAEGGVRYGGIFLDQIIREDFAGKCPGSVLTLRFLARDDDGNISTIDAGRAGSHARDLIDLERFLIDAKHAFSQPDVVEFDEPAPPTFEQNYRLTRVEVDSLVSPMLDLTIHCCEAVLQRAGVGWKDIARIILVGGSCNLPTIREKLNRAAISAGAEHVEICWRRISGTNRILNPQSVVCEGAAIAFDESGVNQMGDQKIGGHSDENIADKPRYEHIPRVSQGFLDSAFRIFQTSLNIVVMRGSGCGKSCLLFGTYAALDGVGNWLALYSRSTQDDTELATEWASLLLGDWPPCTYDYNYEQRHFDLRVGTIQRFGISWHNSPAAARGKSPLEEPEAGALKTLIKGNSSVLFCVSAVELQRYVDMGIEVDSIRWLNRFISREYGARALDPLAIIVVVTQADLCSRKILDRGIEALRTGPLSAFFTGSPWTIAFCETSLCSRAANGQATIQPIGFHVPISLAVYSYLDSEVARTELLLSQSQERHRVAECELQNVKERLVGYSAAAVILPFFAVARMRELKIAKENVNATKAHKRAAHSALATATAKRSQFARKISEDAFLYYKGGQLCHIS